MRVYLELLFPFITSSAVNFRRTELPAPDVTRRFLIARWVNLGSTASISGHIVDRVTHYVMVTNDEGEITDARSHGLQAT